MQVQRTLLFFFLILEKGKGREKREGEKHRSVGPLIYVPSRDQVCNPGMHPDQELNPQPLGLQDDAPTN